MIKNGQKAIIHIYKNAAQLPQQVYRDLLLSHSGVSSAADRRFSQSAFDNVMAALETILFQRVHAGEVANPIGRVRRIGKEYYWRKRRPSAGLANSRHLSRIRQLWSQLKEWLPDESCGNAYLQRIVHKATGRAVPGLPALKSSEAGHVIDALKDRLSYAIRNTRATTHKETPSDEQILLF